MKLFKIFLTLSILLSSTLSFGQEEASIWYFGRWAGLDFSTSPPTILFNGFFQLWKDVQLSQIQMETFYFTQMELS